MTEDDLRQLIGRVKRGALSRRGFIRRMAAVGLTAPMATQILPIAGAAPAASQSLPAYTPTQRGGGQLKILYWQASTLLNPHFATGTTNQDASRIFYEPLANWAPDGSLVPVLAAEIPSTDNRTLAEDGRDGTAGERSEPHEEEEGENQHHACHLEQPANDEPDHGKSLSCVRDPSTLDGAVVRGATHPMVGDPPRPCRALRQSDAPVTDRPR